MDAVSASFQAPFSQIPSCSPPKATLVNITFPTNASIRVGMRSYDKTHERRAPSSRATTINTTASTVAGTSMPPPPSKGAAKMRCSNGKSYEAPPPPREQSCLPVRRLPYKKVSPAKMRPQPSFPLELCNTLDDLINNFIDQHPLRPSLNPKAVLSGNHARVGELPPTKCAVEGELPSCLNGAYIRNGPNPQFVPTGAYHLFDGDGMLQALHISDGQATFCSRFVRTYKFTKEEEAGLPIYPNLFALEGMAGFARTTVYWIRVLTGQINLRKGAGLANTGIVFMNNMIMALGESDLPYIVQLTPDGDVETVGQWDFGKKLTLAMTAHPKMDPLTGEVFAFRYGPIRPFLNYFRIGANGEKQPDVPIFSLRQPSFMHDFAITERYAIFPDLQIVMKPLAVFTGMEPPMRYGAGKVSRLGFIPRYAADESEMKWIEVPGFNFTHTVNAWDEKEGEEVVLVAANAMPAEYMLERMDLLHCCVEMVRINLREGKVVSRKPLSTRNLDWGAINPKFVGRKNRYAFMAMGEPMPKISGFVKLDLDRAGAGDCVVAARSFGERCFAGEPYFVPKQEGGDEDDCYLLTYVHDEGSEESRFVVVDGKSPTLDIVASVRLPQRVPYGFHGLFVSEKDLQKQKNWKCYKN